MPPKKGMKDREEVHLFVKAIKLNGQMFRFGILNKDCVKMGLQSQRHQSDKDAEVEAPEDDNADSEQDQQEESGGQQEFQAGNAANEIEYKLDESRKNQLKLSFDFADTQLLKYTKNKGVAAKKGGNSENDNYVGNVERDIVD